MPESSCSETDKPKLLEFIETPCRPKEFCFPKRKFGKQWRSASSKWFDDFPWLHYDVGHDCMRCYVCVNQQSKLFNCRNKEGGFINVGVSNWKDALERFRKHQTSECHKQAMTYQTIVPQCGNAREMSNINASTVMKDNRHCLIKIIQSLKYLARQSIAIQSDKEEESNFIQLLKLRSLDDVTLKIWLEKKTGVKYTSHDIQNEILTLMSHHVLREIVNDIRSHFFSLLGDEYTDISNKEQLSICLRWVTENLDVNEDFLGFYEIQNIKSDTIVTAIKDSLVRFNLSLDKCRGQCYDGASNMLGNKSGVAQQILQVQPRAHPTHCHAHSLSLSVKDATVNSKILTDAMDIVREISILIKFSPKREKMLDDIKTDENYDNVPGVLKLSTTRWTVRAQCFQRVLENYQAIMELWKRCLEEGGLTVDVKARIGGCQNQMRTFELFFGISLGKLLFSHTDNLSRTLQSVKMSALSSKHVADLTRETLQKMRDQDSFDNFYDCTLTKAKRFEFVGEPTLKRKRKRPARFEEGFADPEFSANARDEYRKMYYEALDLITNSIESRFSQPSFKAYEKLETLLLKSLKCETSTEEQNYLKQNFSGDVDILMLQAQLPVFQLMFKDKEFTCFDDIVTEMKNLRPEQRKLIEMVNRVCQLILVNPATSATAERTFSMARRLKTWLRSNMTQARFNSLSILNFHKSRTDKLDVKNIANDFASKNDNRLRNFGKFSPFD